jgi:hypothetical protein
VTGATIDHLISVTILIAALFVAMMTYNGLFASAIDYDRNRQVANKAIDITNTICLSSGNPIDWGKTNETLLGFGLQDPNVGGYALSPYSIMRLNTASDINPLVEYNGTFYNNISTSFGHAILTPIGDCVNYTTVTELLGVNRTYGFSLDITPTLKVTVSQVNTDPLTLNVNVTGSGLPLSGATLKYYLFNVEDGSFVLYPGVTQTNSSGSVNIEFTTLTGENLVYSFVVYASLGGLTGVGSSAPYDALADNLYIVPLIEDFDTDGDGYLTLNLVHSWDTIMEHPSGHAEIKFNSTFYILTSDFSLQEFGLNCSGSLNSGSQEYATTEIPSSEVGLLAITYEKADKKVGTIIVPWGVGALGVPASYGSSFGSGGYDFVATELRQVKIDGISYQVKVSTWSLGD